MSFVILLLKCLLPKQHFSATTRVFYRMNVVWTFCVVISVICMLFVMPENVLAVCTNSCAEAITTCISLLSVYAFWLGVLKICEKCGVDKWTAKRLAKPLKRLYGTLDDKTGSLIALNNATNILGVGSVATSGGIKAMQLLNQGEKLSRAGAMLFVLNATGLQLVPTTILGMRAVLGSQNCASIVLPTVLSTCATTVLGILLVNIAYGRAK